jgi:hypothetical protein
VNLPESGEWRVESGERRAESGERRAESGFTTSEKLEYDMQLMLTIGVIIYLLD